MNRFIRYWNQNRVRIIITILIIAFIIILIQTINYILGQAQDNETGNRENTTIEDTSRPSESVISGEEIPEETTDTNVNIIQEFVDNCNTGNYENAYGLLTQDCKEEVFTTLDDFVNSYFNAVFNTKKTYQLELWYHSTNTYTYRILYMEDNILQTGSVNNTNNIEDYITIEQTNGETGININGFIEKLEVNNTQTINGIQITINTRARYRSTEKYNITIMNTTDKIITLSDGSNGNDICLVDNNDTEYDCILSEIPVEYLQLAPGERRTLEIRFYKMYNPYRRIRRMSFKNITTDKEQYDESQNENLKININIDI